MTGPRIDPVADYLAAKRRTGGRSEVSSVPPTREREFREWIARNNITDLDAPQSKYDYRGAFLAGVGSEINPTDNLPRWPDTFKQHGHPTFSVESKYSTGPNDGGRWEGEKYMPQGDPVADYLKAKGATSQHDYHAEYASGALAKRMAGANKRDLATLKEEEANQHSPLVQSLVATGANIAQGIPGMEAVEAGVGSLASGKPYATSLADLRETTGKIPGALRVGEKMIGAAGTIPFLPANAAKAGAVLGGLDEALSADPDQTKLGRALRAGTGAAVGAATGHVLGKVGTSLKAKFTPTPQDNIIARQAERAASAKRLYAGALSEGRFKEVTPQLKAYLAEPDVAERVAQIRQLTGAGEDVTPELLDQLYKSFADEAKQLEKGLGQIDPSKPNTLRARAQQIGRQKDRLLSALKAPGRETKPPLTLDVAPELHTVEPRITPGRETLQGPIPGADVETVPPSLIRLPSGRLRTDLSNVEDDALASEYRRLAELNQREQALHGSVTERGYRAQYEELPRTEKFGRKGQEDLPDASGTVDPDVLAAVVRRARQQAMDRIGAEMERRPAISHGEDVSFDFGANAEPKQHGPAGPAFQLRGQSDVVKPGVSIQTPSMRVQTAPAETRDIPAMMPGYEEAVQDFARRSAEINAIGKGMNAMQGKTRPTFKQIMSKETKTPETFERWFQSAPENERKAALEGVLGDVRNAYREPGWRLTEGRKAAGKAGNLLDQLDPAHTVDIIRLLSSINAPLANR